MSSVLYCADAFSQSAYVSRWRKFKMIKLRLTAYLTACILKLHSTRECAEVLHIVYSLPLPLVDCDAAVS